MALKVLFCPALQISGRTFFFNVKVSRLRPLVVFDQCSTKMKSMDYWWNGPDGVKPQYSDVCVTYQVSRFVC